MHELRSTSDPNPRIDEVKAVVTLRSGREVKPSTPKPSVEGPNVVKPESENKALKGDIVNKSTPPPFPQALRNKKKNHQPDINIRSVEASEGQHPSA